MTDNGLRRYDIAAHCREARPSVHVAYAVANARVRVGFDRRADPAFADHPHEAVEAAVAIHGSARRDGRSTGELTIRRVVFQTSHRVGPDRSVESWPLGYERPASTERDGHLGERLTTYQIWDGSTGDVVMEFVSKSRGTSPDELRDAAVAYAQELGGTYDVVAVAEELLAAAYREGGVREQYDLYGRSNITIFPSGCDPDGLHRVFETTDLDDVRLVGDALPGAGSEIGWAERFQDAQRRSRETRQATAIDLVTWQTVGSSPGGDAYRSVEAEVDTSERNLDPRALILAGFAGDVVPGSRSGEAPASGDSEHGRGGDGTRVRRPISGTTSFGVASRIVQARSGPYEVRALKRERLVWFEAGTGRPSFTAAFKRHFGSGGPQRGGLHASGQGL